MIRTLVADMCVRLPSRSTVRLVRREGAEWVCAYTVHPHGEVVFSGAWLRRWGVSVRRDT